MDRRGVGRYGRDLIAGLRAMNSLEISEVSGGGLIRAPFTPWGRRYVSAAARRFRADLLHGLHLDLPRTGDIRSVVTIHDVIPLTHPASMPSTIKRAVFRSILEHSTACASRVIVPSALTRHALLDLGHDDSKIVVVPNGVSHLFRPSADEERARARERFGAGRPYIASIWESKAHKNAALLAALASRLDAIGLPLVCLGDPTIEAPIHTLGRLSDQDLRLFYGGAELFLLPSRVEGFGLPVVESLACGVPVVCGRDIGAARYVSDGVVEVDPLDAGSVLAEITALIADDARREALSENGARQVAELSLIKMATRTASVYERALLDS